MQALEKLRGTNKVTLVCIPGHQGTVSNEAADKLAKERTNRVPSDQIAGIPFAVGKEVIRIRSQ
jgi:ribonuclease HI